MTDVFVTGTGTRQSHPETERKWCNTGFAKSTNHLFRFVQQSVRHVIDMLEPRDREGHMLPSQRRKRYMLELQHAILRHTQQPRAVRSRFRWVKPDKRAKIARWTATLLSGKALERGLVNMAKEPGVIPGVVEFDLPDGRVVTTGSVQIGMQQAEPRDLRGRRLERSGRRRSGRRPRWR